MHDMQIRSRPIAVALCLLAAFTTHADHQGPWKRHTIDDSSRGADGVRLGDINGDGLMDIATGWEEGGIVRVYLNPGPEKSKDKWPAVTVGEAKDVEDAVLVDLDNDGTLDVVSSCEGKTKTMFVHWGPKDQAKLLDEDAWKTEPIPVTVGKQQWMYADWMALNDNKNFDLIVGSKGKDGAIGWLESPDNPRDLAAWRYHKIADAGWVMSLERASIRVSSRPRIIVTDRKGPSRGVYWLTRPKWKAWELEPLEVDQAEYMFATRTQHVDDGLPTSILAATRNGYIQILSHPDFPHLGPISMRVPNPFDVKHGKAVAVTRVDSDRIADLVVSFNTQGQKDKPGVAWIKVLPDKDPKDWPAYDISGLEGKKFDRLELIDLDGDGDLDVLTCEEADNLGVIWYENPYGKAEDQ